MEHRKTCKGHQAEDMDYMFPICQFGRSTRDIPAEIYLQLAVLVVL